MTESSQSRKISIASTISQTKSYATLRPVTIFGNVAGSIKLRRRSRLLLLNTSVTLTSSAGISRTPSRTAKKIGKKAHRLDISIATVIPGPTHLTSIGRMAISGKLPIIVTIGVIQESALLLRPAITASGVAKRRAKRIPPFSVTKLRRILIQKEASVILFVRRSEMMPVGAGSILPGISPSLIVHSQPNTRIMKRARPPKLGNLPKALLNCIPASGRILFLAKAGYLG